MQLLEHLGAKNLARALGLVFLLSMPLGAYSLALTEGVDLSAEGLLVLGGDFSSLVGTYRTAALLDFGVALLTFLMAVGLFGLLSPVSGRLAGTVALLKLVDAACKALLVALSLKLASFFEAGVTADLFQAAERVRAQAWYVFHYGLAVSSLGFAITFFLLFKSRYIPQVLSAYGVLASLGVVGSITAMVLIEGASAIVYPWYVMANGVAFIGLTAWFLVAGVNTAWWQEQHP